MKNETPGSTQDPTRWWLTLHVPGGVVSLASSNPAGVTSEETMEAVSLRHLMLSERTGAFLSIQPIQTHGSPMTYQLHLGSDGSVAFAVDGAVTWSRDGTVT